MHKMVIAVGNKMKCATLSILTISLLLSAGVAKSSPMTASNQDDAITRAVNMARVIKQRARNPGSVKFEMIGVTSKFAACYEYRAQNGFGGTNVMKAVFAADGTDFQTSEMPKFIRLWNRECAGKKIISDAASLVRLQSHLLD